MNYKIMDNGNINTPNKIIPSINVDKLTNIIFDNKYLENSYPFQNTIELSKKWAIELLIKEHKFQWVKDAIK